MNNSALITTEEFPPPASDGESFRLVRGYLDVLCELYEDVREKGGYSDPCVDERTRLRVNHQDRRA